MKKSTLKTLAITLSMVSLLNVSPISTNASPIRTNVPSTSANVATDSNSKQDSSIITSLIDNVKEVGTNIKYYVNENSKDILLDGVIMVAITAVSTACSLGLVKFMSYLNYCSSKESLQKTFHTEKNKLTKRSEVGGYDGGWVACLQTLLKDRGIKKSQKEIYKSVTNRSPSMFDDICILRSEYIGAGKYAYIGQVRNYIEKVSNNKYTFKVEYIDAEKDSSEDICSKIKSIYAKNGGNSPISINDYIWWWNTVNIVGIDKDNNIIVEDPYTGLRRTEPLKNFADGYKGYRETVSLTKRFKDNKIPGIPVFYIAPNEKA